MRVHKRINADRRTQTHRRTSPSEKTKTSIGAKSSFSRPAVVKVVDQLELFMLIFSSKESQLTSCAISSF